jgi:hypothetical protein
MARASNDYDKGRRLPLGGAADQLLYFALFRSAWVIAGFERFFGGALFSRGAFGFLTFFFGELLGICHEILEFCD